MKTFINALRVVAATLLFVSLSSLGFLGGCCNKQTSCAPQRSCAPGCKLQPEPVKIRKTCDNPGYYKQVCHLEYVPCDGEVKEFEAYPKFIGCFDEQGNRIDGNGAVAQHNGQHHVAYTNDVVTEVVDVPAVYEQKATRANNGRASRRGTRRMNNNANAAMANTANAVDVN